MAAFLCCGVFLLSFVSFIKQSCGVYCLGFAKPALARQKANPASIYVYRIFQIFLLTAPNLSNPSYQSRQLMASPTLSMFSKQAFRGELLPLSIFSRVLMVLRRG